MLILQKLLNSIIKYFFMYYIFIKYFLFLDNDLNIFIFEYNFTLYILLKK